jgi:OmpA-OmpF porin, OOP family
VNIGTANCQKLRLPKTINSYERIIVPVITTDGKYLYFDRKNHPENTGSINDPDDIWRCRRLLPSDFEQYDTMSVPIQDSDINLLLQDKTMNDIVTYYKSKIHKDNNGNGIQVVDSLSLLDPENIGSPLNTNESDVIFTITPDGNSALVYGIYDTLKGSKHPGFSIAKLEGGKWSSLQPLEIDNYYNNPSMKNGFSTRFFYGSLSADCRTIILALNRNEGIGDLDLYVSFLKDNNTWTTPKSLGNKVNTSFTEAAPHLALDGKTLYFASDGRKGSGMLDLYLTRRLDDTWKNWSEPVNLGSQINSEFDEKGIYLSALGNEAYIVSKDTAEKRYGMYKITLNSEFMPEPYTIYNGNFFAVESSHLKYYSGKVKISLYNEDEASPYYVTMNQSREYYISVQNDRKSRIKFEAENSKPVEFIVEPKQIDKPVILKKDILFAKQPEPIAVKLSLLFDYNDDHLTDSSVNVLNKYFPAGTKVKMINITGHADEQGTSGYNMDLSMRRARNVAKYLSSLGISHSLISTEWKGSKQPVSTDLSRNRRVEIEILIEQK